MDSIPILRCVAALRADKAGAKEKHDVINVRVSTNKEGRMARKMLELIGVIAFIALGLTLPAPTFWHRDHKAQRLPVLY